jgi:hypothetical protein
VNTLAIVLATYRVMISVYMTVRLGYILLSDVIRFVSFPDPTHKVLNILLKGIQDMGYSLAEDTA